MKLFALLIISVCILWSTDYEIKDNQFYTKEGKVPSECIANLMTELNGDNVIASIYLNRPSLRGCIASNIPYVYDSNGKTSYKILERFDNDEFLLESCIFVSGSMGKTCSNIQVKFIEENYNNNGTKKKVLVLKKLGEMY